MTAEQAVPHHAELAAAKARCGPQPDDALHELIAADTFGADDVPEPADWLTGSPMDPQAVSIEPLATVPGFPFVYQGGASGVIVGQTGGGRSALVQVCCYDAARAGLRCAYLGGEITPDEFNARAGTIARKRGDTVDEQLRGELAAVRYVDLASAVVAAWQAPQDWIERVVDRFDVLVIDPLSAIASALDFDFDKSNAEYIRAFDRLIAPLVARGITVVIVENVGHGEDARRRAKGVSAKGDKADLSFSCAASVNPPGLAIRCDKARSVRAPFHKGDEWVFTLDTQRIQRREATPAGQAKTFRPTAIMEKASRLIEQTPGLSKAAIRKALGVATANTDLALAILHSEGYVNIEKHRTANIHNTIRPYRQSADEHATDDPETSTATTATTPRLKRDSDAPRDTATTRLLPRRGSRDSGHGHNGRNTTPTATLPDGWTIADLEAVAAEYAQTEDTAQ